jgi:hypothetical protein
MPGCADSGDGYQRLHSVAANIFAEPRQKPLTQSRHRSTNPIARGRISGFVQSGVNEIAHSARPNVIAARPHRSLQIKITLDVIPGCCEAIPKEPPHDHRYYGAVLLSR